jgi:LacI family transcriptional regulator, gluconate utilization system Gnt-I transcriptional repressor
MDPRSQRRLAGYRQELELAGPPGPERVLTVPHASSVTLGRRLMADFLALHPDADAVFCNNDDIALGALFECMRRGIRVPAQMGIAGSTTSTWRRGRNRGSRPCARTAIGWDWRRCG